MSTSNNQNPKQQKKLPELRRDFDNAKSNRQKVETQKKKSSDVANTFQGQLKALEAQRQKANLNHNLPAPGNTKRASDQQAEIARQKRVEEIKRKMSSASQNLRKQFKRAAR